MSRSMSSIVESLLLSVLPEEGLLDVLSAASQVIYLEWVFSATSLCHKTSVSAHECILHDVYNAVMLQLAC